MPATKLDVFPNRVEISAGAGCSFAIFGGMFILAGLFVLLFVTRSAEHAAYHSLFERLVGGGIGLAFMLVGGVFAFTRNGIVVDGADLVIRKWTRILTYESVTDTIPFGELARFAIVTQGPSLYAVVVQSGTTSETLVSSDSYSMAREYAERIGAFLPLECQDEVESP